MGDIIDHWVDEHDINIHENNMSAKVKDWNKALEKHEDRIDLSNETEFTTNTHTHSPRGEPTVTASGSATHGDLLQIGREIEEKLNSFKTELLGRIENGPMREASDSIKRLTTASSSCSKKISEIATTCQNNGAAIANISACQKENNAKFEALDSAAGRIKQDIAFIQVRNEQFMSNQADSCNKMAAMESKMAAMESKMGEVLSSTANVSVSVRKELETFEKKLNEEMLSSTTNVSVSVQKELKNLKDRLNEAGPNFEKLIPDQKTAKPVPEVGLIKS